MAPKPDVSAERKQQIFDAALACFSRNGYYQTTMDDIVAESGLSKGALYWYFDSKKEIFLGLFQVVMDQFGEGWVAVAEDPDRSAVDKLRDSLSFFEVGLEELIPFFGLMLEAWALTSHDEDVGSLIREFYVPYLQIMESIVQQGVENGEFSAADARATALVVMTLFDGIALAFATGIWTEDWHSIVRAAKDLIYSGLGVPRDNGR